jgi:hypothetical protein
MTPFSRSFPGVLTDSGLTLFVELQLRTYGAQLTQTSQIVRRDERIKPRSLVRFTVVREISEAFRSRPDLILVLLSDMIVSQSRCRQ